MVEKRNGEGEVVEARAGECDEWGPVRRRRRRGSYDDETVAGALETLAKVGGCLTACSEATGIPVSTLQTWRDRERRKRAEDGGAGAESNTPPSEPVAAAREPRKREEDGGAGAESNTPPSEPVAGAGKPCQREEGPRAAVVRQESEAKEPPAGADERKVAQPESEKRSGGVERPEVCGEVREANDGPVEASEGTQTEDGFRATERDAVREGGDAGGDLGSRPTGRKDMGLPEEVRRWIEERRRGEPQVGFKRIAQELREHHFLVVSRKKIREVLKEAGLLETNDSSFDGGKEPKGTRRFEAPEPRALYQMDVTYVYLEGVRVLYLVSVVDDHSRFCLRSQLCLDQGSETMIEVLHKAIEEHGRPEAVLTDQGRAFYSWGSEGPLFQKYVDDLQVEHIVSEPNSPQTIGKLERFNQTIKRELFRRVRFKSYGDAVQGIEAWVYEYNYRRPHQGLGGQTPASRFFGVASGEKVGVEKVVAGVGESVEGRGIVSVRLWGRHLSVIMKEDEWELVLDGRVYVPTESPLARGGGGVEVGESERVEAL